MQAPFRSISKKYCTDLENLLQTLSSCQLHYIRDLIMTHLWPEESLKTDRDFKLILCRSFKRMLFLWHFFFFTDPLLVILSSDCSGRYGTNGRYPTSNRWLASACCISASHSCQTMLTEDVSSPTTFRRLVSSMKHWSWTKLCSQKLRHR